MELFYSPGAVSLASVIALEEAGADYRLRRVDFRASEQRSPAYLAVNPKGRVPALAVGGVVLTETPAILTYIAETHPAAGLAPVGDPLAFARMQSVMAWLASTVHVAHAHKFRGARWADDPAALAEMTRKVPETMRECARQIEADVLTGPYAIGEAYSLADMHLFTIERWLEADGVALSGFPRISAHIERVAARPAVAAALKAEAA